MWLAVGLDSVYVRANEQTKPNQTNETNERTMYTYQKKHKNTNFM